MQNRNDFVQRFSDLRLGIRPDPGHREDLKHKILNDRFGNVVEIFRTDKEGSHAVMMQDVFEDREITLDLMTVMAEANIRFFEDVYVSSTNSSTRWTWTWTRLRILTKSTWMHTEASSCPDSRLSPTMFLTTPRSVDGGRRVDAGQEIHGWTQLTQSQAIDPART